jgi:hypothetical protein
MRIAPLLLLTIGASACVRTASVAPPAAATPSAATAPAPAYPPALTTTCAPPGSPSPALRPLMIVDGKLLTCAERAAFRRLQPSEIQRIDVIKGRKTEEHFGAAIPNGVMLITTKKNRP